MPGDWAVVLLVVGEIDHGHSTATQFFLNGVAVGEGRFQGIEGVRHGRSPEGDSPTTGLSRTCGQGG